MAKPATSLQLGPITISDARDTQTRMALLLWGPSSAGKSTWSATAPGRKLWLSFGDNEHASVMHREDVQVAQTADMTVDELFKHAQGDNPFGLDQFLAANSEIETVVADSVTALAYRALQKAVADGHGSGRTFRPTMEAPGISAYGARNGTVLEVLTGLLRVTLKHSVNLIITAHEDDPKMKKDDRGNDTEQVDHIPIMLGGKLVNNTTWRLSEIWYMSEDRGQRRIATRPTRLRRPMKTRIFRTDGAAEFSLDYDPNLPDDASGQMTIAHFQDQWLDGGFAKIPVPTTDGGNAAKPRRDGKR